MRISWHTLFTGHLTLLTSQLEQRIWHRNEISLNTCRCARIT